jgi:hypothetical protein
MPVIATPAASPRSPSCDLPVVDATPTPVACAGQFVLAATPGRTRGKPVLARTQAIKIFGGQAANIAWTMRDQEGHPIDLTDCLCPTTASMSSSASVSSSSEALCPYALKFRMTEDICLSTINSRTFFSTDVTVSDAANGVVSIVIPDNETRIPGVYFGQVALTGTDAEGAEYVIFANTFYLYVEKTAWSSRRRGAGPPTIAEIRMHLRDSSPQESFLLDNIRFDDAEIAAAAALPVAQWNEEPPPIATYTTQNFPFRYNWLQAICGHLFLMVAEQYRANNLKYSAAGIAIDDQDKEPNYEKAAQFRLGLWKTWLRQKKVSMNLADAWGGIGSDYGRWG